MENLETKYDLEGTEERDAKDPIDEVSVDFSAQLSSTLNGYLESLKEQKCIQYDSSVILGEPYVIEGYYITKQGFVVEKHREVRTLARSVVESTDWWVRKLSGPHRSRRILHKKAKHFLRGERQPVTLNIQPITPLHYISLALEVKNGNEV